MKRIASHLSQLLLEIKDKADHDMQWHFGFEIYMNLEAFLKFLVKLLNKKNLRIELISEKFLIFEIKQK